MVCPLPMASQSNFFGCAPEAQALVKLFTKVVPKDEAKNVQPNVRIKALKQKGGLRYLAMNNVRFRNDSALPVDSTHKFKSFSLHIFYTSFTLGTHK